MSRAIDRYRVNKAVRQVAEVAQDADGIEDDIEIHGETDAAQYAPGIAAAANRAAAASAAGASTCAAVGFDVWSVATVAMIFVVALGVGWWMSKRKRNASV